MTFDAMVTEIVVICFQISIFASLGTALRATSVPASCCDLLSN